MHPYYQHIVSASIETYNTHRARYFLLVGRDALGCDGKTIGSLQLDLKSSCRSMVKVLVDELKETHKAVSKANLGVAEVAKRRKGAGVILTSLADFAMSAKAGGAAIVCWAGLESGGGTGT
jgi:hypothetical protein